VQNQTYKNYEVILIDDGSDDQLKSKKIFEKFNLYRKQITEIYKMDNISFNDYLLIIFSFASRDYFKLSNYSFEKYIKMFFKKHKLKTIVYFFISVFLFIIGFFKYYTSLFLKKLVLEMVIKLKLA